jgi:receptor expression-enhancing protein 5/6
MEHIAQIEKSLDKELGKHSVFLQLERSTGIKKTRIVAGAVAALLVFILLKFIADIAIAIVIFAYPAAMTVSAIESTSKVDDIHWLVYWMVVTLVGTVEKLTFGLMQDIIPFYPIVKLAFCVWLFLPQTRGATVVYQRVIHPIVAAYKDTPFFKSCIAGAAKAGDAAMRGAASGRAAVQDAARDAAKKAVSDAIDQETSKKQK